MDELPTIAHSADRTDDSLAQCIVRSREHILSRQRADGSWDEACDAGPASTAQALVALATARCLDEDTRRRAVLSLLDAQREDGGFEPHPSADRSELGATASALAALTLCAKSAREHAARERARRFVDAHGGAHAVVMRLGAGDLAALFLCAAGELAAKMLPDAPWRWLEIAPLRAIVEGRVHGGAALVAAEIAVIRAHGMGAVSPALARCVRSVHDEFQNPMGGFVNIVPHTSAAIVALCCAGLTVEDDRVARAVAFLRREFEPLEHDRGVFAVFHSSVWTTALSLRALLRSGVCAAEPAVERGLRWLVSAQSAAPQARSNQRTPGAPREGGFGFQSHNERMTDSDDTAVALDAMGAALSDRSLDPALRALLRDSSRRALRWLYAMQNSDGGWPAFVHGMPSKPKGPIMTRPLELWPTMALARDLAKGRVELFAMGDPSTEDVTARVLRSLAHFGARDEHPLSARGVAFLRAQQCDNGAFWGRWSTNYLWATAHVLLGLAATGAALNEPWVQRAIDWMLSKQNRDGGFGESVESYRDPSLAGVGASMPAVTALVLEALVARGYARHRAARMAAKFLLETQLSGGGWPDRGHLQVVIAPDAFYRYGGASRFQPLEALAAYRSALEGTR